MSLELDINLVVDCNRHPPSLSPAETWTRTKNQARACLPAEPLPLTSYAVSLRRWRLSSRSGLVPSVPGWPWRACWRACCCYEAVRSAGPSDCLKRWRSGGQVDSQLAPTARPLCTMQNREPRAGLNETGFPQQETRPEPQARRHNTPAAQGSDSNPSVNTLPILRNRRSAV